MVLEFCSKCRVLVMRRRERLLANVSLMLLASCCLVICTDQSREERDVDRSETTSSDRLSTKSVFNRNEVNFLRQEAEVLRIASELCARFPEECHQVSDGDNYGEFNQRPTSFTGTLTGRGTPPWPLKRVHELFKVEGARQLIRAMNHTWGGRPAEGPEDWTEKEAERSLKEAGSLKERGAAGFVDKIEQRALRDPQRATHNTHLGRLRQRWQQRNMDQHIVAALPSAFAFAAERPEALLEAGESSARARSTRQQRSGDEQQLSLPRRWVSLDGGPSEATKGQYSSTTSGHQIIQASLDEEAAMQCGVRQFRFTATKTDDEGNRCSGEVQARICYGGCDTGEIADWLFPGKKSIHKVCRHGRRLRRRVLLNDCNNDSIGQDNSLRVYHYVDAQDCVCKKCSSVDTTCLGTMSRPYLQTLQGASTDEQGGDD